MNKPEFGTEGAGLSPIGERRREEILGTLQRAMNTRRRRRRGARAAGVLAALALVIGGAVVLASRGVRTTGTGTPGPIATGPVATHGVENTSRASGMITLVRDDPGILERVGVRRVSAVKMIDDDELSELLDEAGRPSGLVRTRGRVYLASDIGAARRSETGTVN